jgi:hypothetical protein
MHSWLTFVLLGVFVPALSGAEGLKGTISDPDGLVVPGAVVVLRCGGHNKFVESDSRGQFEFFAKPAGGACEISVTHPGFSRSRESVDRHAGSLTIRLSVAPLSQAVSVASEPDPLLRPAFSSISLSGDELRTISNNTRDMIRYAKQLAGVTTGPDVVIVDGLPSSTLPPAEMIARITINGEPFSAEFSDGDLTHIDIITRNSDRRFRYGFGGLSLGVGSHNTLDPNLRSDSRSGNGYVSGPVPHLPLTFSLHGTFASNLNQQPIEASFPDTPAFAADRKLKGIADSNLTWSGSIDLDYSHAETFRAHFAYFETRTNASNAGAGGLTLPEAGLSSSMTSREVRATLFESAGLFTYEGGLAVRQTNSDARANSDDLGVTVLGDFVSGGAPIASNEVLRTAWTWKNVFRSALAASPWSAGVSISGSEDLNQEVPNSAGAVQFANLQAYTDALAGQGTGTLFIMRGNGTARYANKVVAPFVQKQLLHSARFVVTAGLRGDYQSKYGILVSPRLSAATQWCGFVFRTGGGLFVRNIPNDVLMKVTESDGSHLRQFMINDVSLAGAGDVASQITGGQSIRLQLASNLTRPRDFMVKSSLERPMGHFTPGIEYTWTSDLHLLGSRRLSDGSGWLDLLEANRSSERRRLHTRISYKWGRQMVMAHYERIRSYDDTSGPFSFPAQQDNLRAEWARSAGISPHNVSLAANFNVPTGIFLSLTESWRSSAPYNLTTSLDPVNNGLNTDRGGRPRNSGDGPSFNSVNLYGHKRIPMPIFLFGSKKRVHVDLGVQVENILNNKNYLSFGSIIGSPTLGQPLAGSAGRTARVWVNLN